jgi:hypothetical protein
MEYRGDGHRNMIRNVDDNAAFLIASDSPKAATRGSGMEVGGWLSAAGRFRFPYVNDANRIVVPVAMDESFYSDDACCPCADDTGELQNKPFYVSTTHIYHSCASRLRQLLLFISLKFIAVIAIVLSGG